MADIYLDKTPTVGELIERLKTFDPSLTIQVKASEIDSNIGTIYDFSDSTKNKCIMLRCDS
jgi:hypothetical protein